MPDISLNAETLIPLKILKHLGKTNVSKIQKITFLVNDRVNFPVNYSFKSYDFGPKSNKIEKDLNNLEKKGLIIKKEKKTFSGGSRIFYELSDLGENILEEIENEYDFGNIDSGIKQYNNYSFRELVEEIYEEYPEWDEKMNSSVYRKK